MYLIAFGNLMHRKVCEFWISSWDEFIKESLKALENLNLELFNSQKNIHDSCFFRPYLGIYIFFNHNWITGNSQTINNNNFIIPARNRPFCKIYKTHAWMEEDKKYLEASQMYIQSLYEEQDDDLKYKNETYLKIIFTTCKKLQYEIPYFSDGQMKSYSHKLNKELILNNEENFQYIQKLIYTFNSDNDLFKSQNNSQKTLKSNYQILMHQTIDSITI